MDSFTADELRVVERWLTEKLSAYQQTYDALLEMNWTPIIAGARTMARENRNTAMEWRDDVQAALAAQQQEHADG